MCCCDCQWHKIVKETEPLLDKIFVDNNGEEHVLYGLVHAKEDYYYGMANINTGKTMLLSCVGDMESYRMVMKDD